MIKFQQSQALTSHFESFWSIVISFFHTVLSDYKKIREINSAATALSSKNVSFQKSLVKQCELKFLQFPYCVVLDKNFRENVGLANQLADFALLQESCRSVTICPDHFHEIFCSVTNRRGLISRKFLPTEWPGHCKAAKVLRFDKDYV